MNPRASRQRMRLEKKIIWKKKKMNKEKDEFGKEKKR